MAKRTSAGRGKKEHGVRISNKPRSPKRRGISIDVEQAPARVYKIVLKNYMKGHFNDAPHEHEFVLADGSRIKNLLELAGALDTMSHDIFEQHVNEYKNDFVNWIRDVLQETGLAERLLASNAKERHQIEILRHMLHKILSTK